MARCNVRTPEFSAKWLHFRRRDKLSVVLNDKDPMYEHDKTAIFKQKKLYRFRKWLFYNTTSCATSNTAPNATFHRQEAVRSPAEVAVIAVVFVFAVELDDKVGFAVVPGVFWLPVALP